MKRLSSRVTSLFSAFAVIVPLALGSGPAASSTLDTSVQPGPDVGDRLDVVDLASRYVGSHLRYRIPAMTTTEEGDLLAVYDGRPTMADLPSNIALLMRRSGDGGLTWDEPQVIRQDPAPNGYGDPSVLVDREKGRIFVFYAASINRGFANSGTGNDDDDPDILHADYSYSDDDGRTWTHRRITSMIKDPSWGGMFAASGEGIQLRHGEHAGRLIQQYTIRKDGANYAVSAYSDDHGETWQMGELVGPGADENKTVELSDGRVMLNSRAAPYRKVAISEDGGRTYGPFEDETQLIDPANNGSIMRVDPDAAPDDPRASWLLFSNTEDTGIRRNLTVKMSCDDGETWPISKVVEEGAAAYSTMTPLPDGQIGLFYEREGYRHMSVTRFGLDWLEGVCAPLSADPPTWLDAGETTGVPITVTNQSGEELPAGSVEFEAPQSWETGAAEVPAIAAGESATVTVDVTAAADAATGTPEIPVSYTTGAATSHTTLALDVMGGTPVLTEDEHHELDGSAVDLSDRLDDIAGLDAGSIAVSFATTDRAPAANLLSASDSSSTVKDVILSLNNGRPYFEVRRGTTDYPVRINTSVDVADGERHTLVVSTADGLTRLFLDGQPIGQANTQGFFADVDGLDTLTLGANVAETGERWGFTGTVDRLTVADGAIEPAPELTLLPVLDAIYPGGDHGLLGDSIAPWIRISNTGNVALRDIRMTGNASNASSCDLAGPLAPGASTVCRSVRHTVTHADVAAGSYTPAFTVTAAAPDGSRTEASAEAAPIDLTEAQDPDAVTQVWVPTGAFESSSFERVPRAGSAESALAEDTTLRLQVPQGGRASAQLAVTAPDGLSALSADAGELTGPRGSALGPDAVQVRFPQYIPDEVNGGVVADPLLEIDSVDVSPGHNQPIWFTLTVPEDTPGGRYTGAITLSSDEGEIGRWDLQLDVPDVALRPMADRPFFLNLWAQPDAIAEYHDVELWSDEHFRAMRPYLEDLAAHGQRVVDVAITEDPWMVNHQGEWRPQTQSSYHSTVEWLWDGDEFTFDFSVFDRYVTESRDAGIGDTIHAFAMLQFDERERFVYTDTRTGERIVEEVELAGSRYREGWTAFLIAFREHLEDRGWFDDTRLAFDERPIATMEAAFGVIEEAGPEWMDKIALAANSLAEADIADFISFNYSFLDDVPDELIQQRRDNGEPTLYYTFYDPVRPNTVTASPPVSSRVLGWVVEQRDLDGYLRWTYNSWPHDVYNAPSFRYGQGDEYLVYPGENGPVSSIRWEMFRDGQDDAELLNLAKDELGADHQVVVTALDEIDPRAEGVPATWASMLQQRANVLDAMATLRGATVEARVEGGVVAAGGRAEVTVEITAGASAVPAPELDFAPRTSGEVDIIESPDRGAIPPGRTATWVALIDVPADAANLTVISGRVVRGGSEQVLGSFTAVATIEPVISLTGPLVADPASSPNTSEPVTVTVPVRNIGAEPETITLDVSDLGFWEASPSSLEVDVPAHSEIDASIELDPAGQAGWTTITAGVEYDGVQLASRKLDIVSGGRHVSDWSWVDEVNGWGPAERDTANGEAEAGDGPVMSIGGRTYAKGVGAHAVSRITLDLAGTCSYFESDYGIDDYIPASSPARVDFAVVGDGTELWSSGPVTAAQPAQWTDRIDVTGVETLELVVGDGGNGIGQAHGNWAGAWLRCPGP